MNTTLKLKSNSSFNPNPNHFNPKFSQNYTLTPKFPQNYILTPKNPKLHFNPKIPQITFWPQTFPKSHFDPKTSQNHTLTPNFQNHILAPNFPKITFWPLSHTSIPFKLYKQSWDILYKLYKHIGINSKLKFIYLYLIVLFFSWIPCLYDYNMIFHMK